MSNTENNNFLCYDCTEKFNGGYKEWISFVSKPCAECGKLKTDTGITYDE